MVAKDVIIKNLHAENERLRGNVNNLENKVTSLEINQNMLEQYGRRNNIEVSGIPDSVEDNCLEEKVNTVFTSIGIDVKSKLVIELEKVEIFKKKNNCPFY